MKTEVARSPEESELRSSHEHMQKFKCRAAVSVSKSAGVAQAVRRLLCRSARANATRRRAWLRRDLADRASLRRGRILAGDSADRIGNCPGHQADSDRHVPGGAAAA